MKIYSIDEFVNEKLNIQPISKKRLQDLQIESLPGWSDHKLKQEAMKWAEESAQWLVDNKENGGCCFFKLGASKCKTGEMYIVMGWNGGFDEDDTQNPYADGEYRICTKLAYNCDSLQCDYEFDWEMPYDEKTGDVDDTDTEYSEPNDVLWQIEHWQELYRLSFVKDSSFQGGI